MSVRWTDLEVAAYEAAQRVKKLPREAPAVADERELHASILSECRKRGWICLHGSMAHRTARTIGEPDFVILADAGRALLVEAKAKGGKLSEAQRNLHAWSAKLGHKVHVVRNLEEFLSAANPNNLEPKDDMRG